MNKREIRKEFLKLKNKGFSYTKCKTIVKSMFDYNISIRTLKRWIKRFDSTDWDLNDLSTKPNIIHYKITLEIEQEVIKKPYWLGTRKALSSFKAVKYIRKINQTNN